MDFCYICGSDRDPHLLMICDICDFQVAHTTCCGYRDFPEDWICAYCDGLEVDESDSYFEEESSESSQEASYSSGSSGAYRLLDTMAGQGFSQNECMDAFDNEMNRIVQKRQRTGRYPVRSEAER
jgi:hypothetical protein